MSHINAVRNATFSQKYHPFLETHPTASIILLTKFSSYETCVPYMSPFINQIRKNLWETDLMIVMIAVTMIQVYHDQSRAHERWYVDVFRIPPVS
ncbi:hypothetical protein AVEN_97009-1 [Araneus ventricosus]|uniref:Uncharacterized protein n=1 Tax=Araneus ventricosus TaxID=182803 RepID=A0A4Y2RYB6_ARAVE|nr:hypothetical protein AVEN_97009-1 [Araneus ventricosus]